MNSALFKTTTLTPPSCCCKALQLMNPANYFAFQPCAWRLNNSRAQCCIGQLGEAVVQPAPASPRAPQEGKVGKAEAWLVRMVSGILAGRRQNPIPWSREGSPAQGSAPAEATNSWHEQRQAELTGMLGTLLSSSLFLFLILPVLWHPLGPPMKVWICLAFVFNPESVKAC